MDPINILISWFKEMQDGKQPMIPYNLHELVRLFHSHVGTTDAIELLEALKKYAKELKKENDKE